MGLRELALAAALASLAACASTQGGAKPHELPVAQRAGVSGALEPLLVAAKLWRGPDDGCAAAYAGVDGDVIGAAVTPHAPCRVRVVLTEVTLTAVDAATLRALLAHEIAHMQLSHPEARQARADAQKATEKNIKTASSAASKAAKFIPGVGGLVSKGIGTARKGVTSAMEMRGTPYLPEEEQAADAMAVTLLDAAEASGCHALVNLLEVRLRAPDDEAWAPWQDAHPVSAERIAALPGSCSDPAVR
jgi:Zn-dependent protease with chaperone function